MRVNKVCLSAICAVAISTVNISAVDLDTISVESSTIADTAVDQKTEASTVNVITEKEITEIDPKNINDLLETIPGVTADVRSDVVEIHIRGVAQQEFMWENTGVTVVIDGVPVMQDGGKVRGINIDDIASIKVIKGGASYLYGENSLAGAIIITTKKNKDKNGGYIKAEQGNYGYENYKLKLYRSADKYSANILASYKYEDGYWWETQNDAKTIGGLFTYYIDDSSDISFNADYLKKYQETTRGSVTGVTEAEENPTGEDDGDWAYSHDYKSDIYKYYIKYNKDFNDGGNLLATTYYYKDLYNYISSPQDLDGDGNDDTYTAKNNKDIKQYGLKAEYRNNYKKLAYMVGIDLGKKKYDSLRVTTSDYSTTRRGRTTYYYAGEGSDTITNDKNYAIYLETKYSLNPKWTMVGNIRYDINKNDYESDQTDYDGTQWSNKVLYKDKNFYNVSYRVGTTYDLNNKDVVYANISTGFRNPRVEDLYAGDIRGTSRGVTYANNPDIDPETTITYEVGVRGNIFSGIRYEASAFITDTKDIISKNSGTYSHGIDGVAYYENAGDARNKGLELSLKSNSRKKVSFSLSYTYLDAYYTSHDPFYVSYEDFDKAYDIVGNQLPRVPHHKIDLIVNYKFMPKWKLMTELYAQSHYYTDETNFVTMPGYAKVNMRVDYNFNKKLSFYVKVDNVLDKQYYRTVYLFSDRNGDNKLDGEDASITVDPGRVAYAGFTFKF